MRRAALAAATVALGACSSVSLKEEAPAPAAPPKAVVVVPAAPTGAAPAAVVVLPAVRNWEEYRLRAAKRMVEANPNASYLSTPPEILLAIPVIEVELNADGSIRRLEVLRQPRQATDTIQLALDAIRRAAPFGDVSRLPRPWKFTETFLFDDARRFKPRSLD